MWFAHFIEPIDQCYIFLHCFLKFSDIRITQP